MLAGVFEWIEQTNVLRPALQANAFQQPAQICRGARVEVEIVGAGFTGRREPDLELLQLGGENRGSPDDAAFSRTRVVLTTQVGQVRRDHVLAAAHPR